MVGDMVMHEAESNFVQWGARLFEGDPRYFSGYYGENLTTAIQMDGSYDNGRYNSGDYYDIADSSHVENDEIIARTLQEEYSQLAVSESSQYSNAVDDPQPLHAYPVPRPDWHFVPASNYSLDQEEESDDVVPASSCSSTGGNEEDRSWPPASIDECGFDDEEVSRRLNDMNSTPHVPKINGEIPSIDEATSDHERLENRSTAQQFVECFHDAENMLAIQAEVSHLELAIQAEALIRYILKVVLGFVEVKVQGDGNCQFRALSDQLYHTPDHHKLVRQQVVNQLKSHWETYEGYVPMEYNDYLRQMSKSGEWGDHVTLQAAADSFGVEIRVVTSYENNGCIDILPGNQKPKRNIFLSFWAEVHYNSIYPQADPGKSSTAFRKKKKWWNFGN